MNKELGLISDEEIASLEDGRRQNPGYHEEVDRLFRFLVPEGVRVCELGCGTGRLIAAVKPSYGLGIDIDSNVIEAAQKIFSDRPELEFTTGDVQNFDYSEYAPFDYVIASDLTGSIRDVQSVFSHLHGACTPETRFIVKFHSNLWRPILIFATIIGRSKRDNIENWLSMNDIKHFLGLSDFEVITAGGRTLLPMDIPVITSVFNRFLAKMPLINVADLNWYVVARPVPKTLKARGEDVPSVSIVIPTRNERGNIEDIFTRTPKMGKWTELLFVDGGSDDGTVQAVEHGIEKHGHEWKRIVLLQQTGKGKAQAVRQAFDQCKGDILMILDSDLTVPPEELPRFYEAITSRRGEFINGSRLIYPMENEAMQFSNMVANHCFALLFTWLLGQPIKDTLCGTKVLWRKDYERIAANRKYFGVSDPFGDFDLLFGASKLNLKLIDLPVHYRQRTYGEIKIKRWLHGILLLRACAKAFLKLKLS